MAKIEPLSEEEIADSMSGAGKYPRERLNATIAERDKTIEELAEDLRFEEIEHEHWHKKYEEKKAENVRLRKALNKYGRHDQMEPTTRTQDTKIVMAGCPRSIIWRFEEPCTCGLDAAKGEKPHE